MGLTRHARLTPKALHPIAQGITLGTKHERHRKARRAVTRLPFNHWCRSDNHAAILVERPVTHRLQHQRPPAISAPIQGPRCHVGIPSRDPAEYSVSLVDHRYSRRPCAYPLQSSSHGHYCQTGRRGEDEFIETDQGGRTNLGRFSLAKRLRRVFGEPIKCRASKVTLPTKRSIIVHGRFKKNSG